MELEQIYKLFPNHADCIKYIEGVLWNGEPVCPYCQSSYQTPAPKEARFHCNNCNTSYSVTTNTIFHKTRVDLQKWFYLIRLIVENNLDKSVREIGIDIGANKDTVAFMIKRIERGLLDNKTQIIKLSKYE